MHYLKSPIFRQTKKLCRKGSVFLLPENQKLTTFAEIDHFCRKMTTFAEKIESLVPLRYSNDR